MTKWRALGLYASCVLAGLGAVILLDVILVELGVGWSAWIIHIAFALVVVVATWGAFGASSPIFGRIMDGAQIDERVVALTFDDGPSPDVTPLVLDALREARARATFFVLGKHAERHPELIERMVREGHEVATHGYDHSILLFAGRREIASQLVRTDLVLRRAGAPPVRTFRVPHGYRNPFVGLVTRSLGLDLAGWSKGVFDTSKPGVDVIVARAKRGLRPGAILLLHDADGSGNDDRTQTAEAVPAILDAVAHAGYETVTMQELRQLAPPRALSWRRLALVGVVVAALVTFGVERLDRHEAADAWSQVRALSLPLVALALLANLLSVAAKATVWKTALESVPRAPRIRYADVVPAIFIGFLLNTVLIARLGEVGRIVVLRRRLKKRGHDLPMPTIAGTLVTEQLILGATLGLVVLVMAFSVQGVPNAVRRTAFALVGVCIALAFGLLALEIWSRYRRHGARRDPDTDLAATWWRSALRFAEGLLHSVVRGNLLFRDPRRTALALAAGLLSWIAQLIGIYWTLDAFGINDSRLAIASSVFLVSNLIGLVPLTPGNVGTFPVAVATIARSFPVSYFTMLTFGAVLQAIEIALGAGVGLICLSREGLSFGQLRRGISRSNDEDEPLPLLVAERPRIPTTA